jgi:hypothetical protein
MVRVERAIEIWLGWRTQIFTHGQTTTRLHVISGYQSSVAEIILDC